MDSGVSGDGGGGSDGSDDSSMEVGSYGCSGSLKNTHRLLVGYFIFWIQRYVACLEKHLQ